MKKAINILIAIFLLYGCNDDKEMRPDRYLKYMEDNTHGIRQTIKIGKMQYVVQLATPAYVVCREFSDQLVSIDKQAVRERLNELDGYVFFLINIPSVPQENVMENMQKKSMADQMAMYYESIAANDIRLWNDSMQLLPAVYHFEDNYGLTPYNTMVAGFRLPQKWSELRLVFNDRYNDHLMIQATYSKETITNLPALKI